MPVHDSATRPAARRTGYSFANQGAAASTSQSGSSVGKHVLKRVPGVDFWSPSWGEETIIRCFPAISQEDRSTFDPYRFSTSYCDFGDWIRVYDAVRNFGNPGITMLLHNGLNPAYDAQLMNPCWILYRSINQALTAGQGMPEWVPFTKGSTGKGAQLSKPSKLYLTQCMIFRHKSQDTFGPEKAPIGADQKGPTIVMGLPPTAGEELIKLLEEKDEDWKGDPNDYAQYKYGDPVGIDAGRFLHIYELGKDPRARFNTQRAANPASIYSASSSGSSRGFGKALEAKGYGIFITETLDGGPGDIPATLTGMEDMVRAKWRPWDTVLQFYSDEEQAHLIAPLFPPNMIMYAWRDHQNWIPDNVRDAGNYQARQPVSSSAPPANMNANPWARPAVVPSAAKAPVTPSVTPSWNKGVTDTVVPTQEISESSDDLPNAEAAGNDPMLAEDADRVAAARAKLEAASKKAKDLANK